MDNASIAQKLKGHELAVVFIGTAFRFRNDGERPAPACITFTTQKSDAPLLIIVVYESAKNIKRLDTVLFLGGGEDGLWGCWLLVA